MKPAAPIRSTRSEVAAPVVGSLTPLSRKRNIWRVCVPRPCLSERKRRFLEQMDAVKGVYWFPPVRFENYGSWLENRFFLCTLCFHLQSAGQDGHFCTGDLAGPCNPMVPRKSEVKLSLCIGSRDILDSISVSVWEAKPFCHPREVMVQREMVILNTLLKLLARSFGVESANPGDAIISTEQCRRIDEETHLRSSFWSTSGTESRNETRFRWKSTELLDCILGVLGNVWDRASCSEPRTMTTNMCTNSSGVNSFLAFGLQ